MRKLRLEWKKDGRYCRFTENDQAMITAGIDEQGTTRVTCRIKGNFNSKNVEIAPIKDPVKPLDQAQVAAEDALQAALLPYAQLWAKLAGVEYLL